MSIARDVDRRAIEMTEAICRRLEQAIGKTNYFWLKVLTGAYGVFLMSYIAYDDLHHISGTSWGTLLLALMFAWVFYVSFFYCDKEESIARERVLAKLKNPRKDCGIFVPIRLSMLSALLMLIALCGLIAVWFSERMHEPIIILYLALSCLTAFGFWLGLLLDACDPLPIAKHSL